MNSSLLNASVHHVNACGHATVVSDPCPSTAGASWLEVVSHLHPRYGGLSASVPALANGIQDSGRQCTSLAAFCQDDERVIPPGIESKRITFWPAGRRAWVNNKALRESFTQELRGCDGVHIHGLWEISTKLAAESARSLGIPYILSAHGMLEPWALRRSRVKKWIYASLVERPNLARAACLHALTVAEAHQYIAFGARSPIAVVPNAVKIPPEADAEQLTRLFPALEGKRLLLFLGRLHPKKGLHNLLEAWAAVAAQWPEAHLVIAGPGGTGSDLGGPATDPYVASLHAMVERLGIAGSVLFTGMLEGERKWNALAAAEGFVLPSHSEGLSVAVLEAMGVGRPVIITAGCNMPEVEQLGAGWQVASTAAELAGALRAWLKNNTAQNLAMGACGARLIKERYTWPIIAQNMASVYAWVLGQGPRPITVPMVDP